MYLARTIVFFTIAFLFSHHSQAQNVDFLKCEEDVVKFCEGWGKPIQVFRYYSPSRNVFVEVLDPNNRPPGYTADTITYYHSCLVTMPDLPGEYNYHFGVFDVGRCEYRFSSNSTVNLTISNPAFSPGSSNIKTVALNRLSVAPESAATINVNVSGSGFTSSDNRTAVVSLNIGTKSFQQSINLSLLSQAGSLSVPFDVTFSVDDVGSLPISASINGIGVQENDTTDNLKSDTFYVLCDVKDKGRIVPFYSQADIGWAQDLFGNPANSINPGTMRKYGCSVTDFAMLAESFGIKKTPLGSPLNPAINGTSSINGLKGEVLNPKSLNMAFANYKTKFTGKGSVALNSANDPVWEGMAEVARAGYRAQCSLPGSGCNPANSASAISLKSFLASGYDNNENSADHKKVMKEICQGNPVILKFKSNSQNRQHFMLATAVDIDDFGKVSFRLNNPGVITKNEGENILQTNLERLYPKILGYAIYRPSADPSMLGVTAPMNIHFVVTDPLGRRTGYDPNTNTFYSEIPGASYGDQSIDTPEEPEYSPETLVAERYFLSPSDTPVGAYRIKTYAVESGNYYLDIRTTDANGFVNDTNYMKGNLAAGQFETININHTEESVPIVNASLHISNYLLNIKNKGRSDVGILFGGKIEPFVSSQIKLTQNFKLTIGGVNGYKLSIPASKFKIKNILKTKIYTYLNKEVKIVLLNSGVFEILIDKSNLQNVIADKAGYLRIDIDSISADAIIGLKCNKNFCTSIRK